LTHGRLKVILKTYEQIPKAHPEIIPTELMMTYVANQLHAVDISATATLIGDLLETNVGKLESEVINTVFTLGCCILLRIYPTWFLMKPSIATKFQRSTLTFYFYSLHVSAPTGHLQVRYTTDAHKDYSYHNGSKGILTVNFSICTFYIFYRIFIVYIRDRPQ
jgi:hypothetical protein